ncbi:uncharacterized protein PAC_19750 [Phialocephala subalpina]|uniref:Uncharacterized protein n=1 Tax=Phialocephala subalpina TaxID=576137 RepID=A0A1L7XXW2_9HELO|nr:uncharacterized protein PAC_19750 [Phialocephala subalpina]
MVSNPRLDLEKETAPKMNAQKILKELNGGEMPKLNRTQGPYVDKILSFLRLEDLALDIPLICKTLNPKIGRSIEALEAYLETNYGEKICTFINKYPLVPNETVGVKVGKHVLAIFSERYVKDEDIEVIFQALLNIYQRFSLKEGTKYKVEKKCLFYQDVIDDQALRDKICQPPGKRLLCWVNNKESIEYAAAKGQQWGVEIRREAMAMWVDSNPTSRDRANSVILQTAAGLKKCLEEGADCKLLKGLGWKKEAREVGGILRGSSLEEVEMAHAAACLALEGEEDGEGPGASQPGSARQRGKYEGAVPVSNYYL